MLFFLLNASGSYDIMAEEDILYVSVDLSAMTITFLRYIRSVRSLLQLEQDSLFHAATMFVGNYTGSHCIKH